MPKNRKRKGAPKKGAGAGGSRPPTDDENSTEDNWSTASVISDGSGINISEDQSGEEQEAEDNTEQENFEERLSECIEGLLEKSGPSRKKYLQGLLNAFGKKYVTDFLEKRKETVADSLLKCLKRGKAEEQVLAAKGVSLLAVQLGDLGPLYHEVQAVLSALVADGSADVKTRAKCASALALCCFLSSNSKNSDLQELRGKMDSLEDVFGKCYRRKDGSLPPATSQMSQLHTSCLNAWSLLLTCTPEFFIKETATTHIPLLADLLQCGDTDLRISAGEAIALLYDLNRCFDEDFGYEEEDTDTLELCEQLKVLSTESTKHIARNALREQRSKFRDILHTVQSGEVEPQQVKMGKLECLQLEDWASKVQYQAFCNVLLSGINTHLQENLVLREVFDLGAPLPVGAKPASKMTKVQRKYYNSQAEKARTVIRGKNRDKRSCVVGF